MPLPKKSDSLMENTSDANKNNGPLLRVTITHCTDTWSLNGIHPTGLDMNTYNMRSRFMRKTHKKHKELPSSASSVMNRHKLKFTIVFQKLILLPWSEKVQKKKKKDKYTTSGISQQTQSLHPGIPFLHSGFWPRA